MQERQGSSRFSAGGAETGDASPRAARCVILLHRCRSAPQALIESFRRRGVEVRVEHEAILALAEIGRCLIERRQRFAADHTSFHQRSDSAAGAGLPSLIFILVAPDDFADADELLACIARSMPMVAIATFDESNEPSLRMLQRSAPTRPAPGANGSGHAQVAESSSNLDAARPEIVVRRARPALRLTPHNADDERRRSPRAAPPDPASTDAHEPENESDLQPLITEEELALLLGDAGDADQPPRAGGAA